MKRFALVAALSVLALVASPVAEACGAKGAAQVAGCPMKMKGVEKTATNLDNGVKITFAAKDAEAVKAMQTALAAEMKDGGCKDCPMHADGVKADVVNTDDGMVLTLTSADAAQVKTLQAYAKEGCGSGGCSRGKAAGKAEGGCPHAAKAAGDRT